MWKKGKVTRIKQKSIWSVKVRRKSIKKSPEIWFFAIERDRERSSSWGKSGNAKSPRRKKKVIKITDFLVRFLRFFALKSLTGCLEQEELSFPYKLQFYRFVFSIPRIRLRFGCLSWLWFASRATFLFDFDILCTAFVSRTKQKRLERPLRFEELLKLKINFCLMSQQKTTNEKKRFWVTASGEQ